MHGVRSWTIRLLIILSLLLTGIPASTPALARAETPSSLPGGSVVPLSQAPSELDARPAEADAVVVDPNNPAWTTRYGTEAGRRFLAPRSAPAVLAPAGPTVPLGFWDTISLQSGTRSITAIASVPDGRLFVGVEDDGLRMYAPDANGVYAWTAIHPPGLASNRVTALAVFRYELWVGTRDAGISAMNLTSGVWRTFNTGNGLPSNWINRLTVVQPPSGQPYVWASTGAGAARYYASKFGWVWSTWPSEGLPNNYVFDVAVRFYGSTTYTWFGTGSSLSRWDGSNWTHYGYQVGTGVCGLGRAKRIIVDRFNAVWVIGEKLVPSVASESDQGPEAGGWIPAGICRWVSGRFVEIWSKPSEVLPNMGAATDMSLDAVGRLWISYLSRGGAKGGAVVHDQGTWGIYRRPGIPLHNDDVNTVQAVGEAVWFGHYNASALSIHSPNWSRYTAADMSASGTPGPLLVEQTTTWVGVGSGISRRNGTIWSHQAIPGNSAAVSALARDGDGTLWIGTAGDGIFTLDGSSTTASVQEANFNHQTAADGLPSNDVRALATDQEGRLWVATAGGLALRGNGYWLPFTLATSPLSSNDLRALTVDATGRLWIGTAANGIDILDPKASGVGAWSTQTTTDGLPSNAVRGLTTDPSGAVWAATSAGVGQWNPTTEAWTKHTTSHGLPSVDTLSIASDPTGRMWGGTTDGLGHREVSSWQEFYVPGSTLGSDRVNAVASDGTRLWASAGSLVSARGVITSPIGNYPPVISSFTPTEGAPLTTVTISGSHFDDRGPAFNKVIFCGDQAGCLEHLGLAGQVTSATSTSLVVKAPALVQSGKIKVIVHELNDVSSAEFEVVPAITGLNETCIGPGEVLEIYGFGFTGEGSAAAYVKIGNGPERVADATDPTLIRQYVRPGDTSGKVRVRLLNNKTATSSQNLSVATLEIASVAVQQGIEGLQMIWGKRTLVQLFPKTTENYEPFGCKARITGAKMEWKKKNGSTVPAGWARMTSANGLWVGSSAPATKSLNGGVNFVADFEDLFPLSQLNGARITLMGAKNAWMPIFTYDLPASSFPFMDTRSNIKFVSMKIAPPNYSGLQHQKFWEEAFDSMADIARVYPQQDENWRWGSNAWLRYTPIWHSFSSVDLSDDSDDFDDIKDVVDDRVDPEGSEQAMALIAKELYVDGPSGKASLGHPTAVTFNVARMGMIFLQEAIHALDWVDEDSPNHDSGNEYHSRYDEAERSDICTTNLTFRQALIDQTGSTKRVVRLRWAEDPYEFSLAGCNRANQPSSAMSYAPGQTNASVFLEPVDYNFTLVNVILSASQAQETALSISAETTLRLGGSIDQSGRVTTSVSYLEEPGKGLTSQTPGGDYHLQVRAADSSLLSDHAFNLVFEVGHAHSEPTSRARFNLRVPFPDGATQAQIRHNGTVLWSQTLSANPPSVNFTSPSGGTYQADGIVPVAWTASDLDGGDLQFGLDYSPDDGQTWIMLVPYLTANAYNWQPDFVPSGGQARLRLRASDGFNMASAISAPFALNSRAPYALIQTPKDGQVLPEGKQISLAGSSLTNDGPDTGQFTWQHDGATIGTGQVISYTLDQVGQQVFHLQVTSAGLSASDTVTVTVIPDYDQDSMSNDWELTYSLNPLDPSDASGDPDDDNLNNVRENQLGTNPLVADTDGDGADDGTEIAFGTDPLVAEQVPPSGPVLNVGVSDQAYTLMQGSLTPKQVAFWVTNGGPGDLDWTASSDAAWLNVSPSNGSAPTELTLTATAGDLAPGTYPGHVTFSAAGASGSPQVINVTLTVEARTGSVLYLPLLGVFDIEQ